VLLALSPTDSIRFAELQEAFRGHGRQVSCQSAPPGRRPIREGCGSSRPAAATRAARSGTRLGRSDGIRGASEAIPIRSDPEICGISNSVKSSPIRPGWKRSPAAAPCARSTRLAAHGPLVAMCAAAWPSTLHFLSWNADVGWRRPDRHPVVDPDAALLGTVYCGGPPRGPAGFFGRSTPWPSPARRGSESSIHDMNVSVSEIILEISRSLTTSSSRQRNEPSLRREGWFRRGEPPQGGLRGVGENRRNSPAQMLLTPSAR